MTLFVGYKDRMMEHSATHRVDCCLWLDASLALLVLTDLYCVTVRRSSRCKAIRLFQHVTDQNSGLCHRDCRLCGWSTNPTPNCSRPPKVVFINSPLILHFWFLNILEPHPLRITSINVETTGGLLLGSKCHNPVSQYNTVLNYFEYIIFMQYTENI